MSNINTAEARCQASHRGDYILTLLKQLICSLCSFSTILMCPDKDGPPEPKAYFNDQEIMHLFRAFRWRRSGFLDLGTMFVGRPSIVRTWVERVVVACSSGDCGSEE